MISFAPVRNPNASGVVWPGTGTATPDTVEDIYGPRTASWHINNYDFHRGIDSDIQPGETVYAMHAGAVVRWNWSHFRFQSDLWSSHFEVDDDSSGAAATFTRVNSMLQVVGTRGGAKTWPNVCKLQTINPQSVCATSWDVRLELDTTHAMAAGQLGIAMHHEPTGESFRLEINGTDSLIQGNGSGGNIAAHGTAAAFTTKRYFRVRLATTTLTWSHSADGETWVDIGTNALPAITDSTKATWTPTLYWRSTDTNATPVTVNVKFFGWVDNNDVGRFGNVVIVAQSTPRKSVQVHLQDLLVDLGDIVDAGTPIGYAGREGWDDTSGWINNEHCHTERANDQSPVYDNDDMINPLAPGFLPRTNVSNNVTVTRSIANDPDAVDSHRLRIQVARAAQDFDVNEIILTGNTTSRTLNFNTRAGMNVDNDEPLQAGVYIVPEAFNSESSEMEFSVYFHRSVVGNTFVSASVKDTEGTTLWSE